MALRESDAARARDNVVPLQPRRSGLRERIVGSMARVPEPGAPIWPGPVAGFVAGLWAAAMSLLVIAAIVLGVWVFAPLGVGEFGDVMRAAGSSWLLADGGSLTWQGATLSLPPLLGTLVIVLLQRRAGRWLASAVAAERISHVAQPFAFAIASAVSAQLLVLASIGGGTSLAHSMIGSLVVAIVGFGWGIDRELGIERVSPVAEVVRAVRLFVAVLGVGSGLVLIALAVQQHVAFGNVLSAIAADSTSTVQVLALCLVYVPTALVWVGSTIVGTGFAVGVGTHVSLSGVSIGALPPMPLLALLPGQIAVSAHLLFVIAMLAAAGAAWQLRADRLLVHRIAVVVSAAVVGAFLGLAASGGFGPGRLQQLGPVWWQLALACAGWVLVAFVIDELVYRLRATRTPEGPEGHAN